MADDILDSVKKSVGAIKVESQAADDPDIVVGYKQGAYAPYTGGTPTNYQKSLTPDTKKLSAIQDEVRALATVNPQGFLAFSRAMYEKGFIKKNQIGQPDVVANNVEYPARLYQAYAKQAGPNPSGFYDWLGSYQMPGGMPEKRGGTGYRGPVTTTSVTLSDPDTAAALLNQAATDMIGRNLTDDEIAKYTSQFNKLERQNPQVTTTTNNRAGTATSTTKTGMDKNEMLRQIITKNPDFARYQIDSTAMDWFANQIKRGQAVING